MSFIEYVSTKIEIANTVQYLVYLNPQDTLYYLDFQIKHHKCTCICAIFIIKYKLRNILQST